MPWVKYPFHVKHNGVDYKPGEMIEVAEAIGHKLRGAVEVEADPAEKRAKPSRRKADKAVEN